MNRFDELSGLMRMGLTRKGPIAVTDAALDVISRKPATPAYAAMVEAMAAADPHAKAWENSAGRLVISSHAVARRRPNPVDQVDDMVGRFAAGDGIENLQGLVKLYQAGTGRNAGREAQTISRDVYALLSHLARTDPRFRVLLKDNGLDIFVPGLGFANFPALHDVTLRLEALDRKFPPQPMREATPPPAGLQWGTLDRTEDQFRKRIGLPRQEKQDA